MSDAIKRFENEFAFLSNFYPSQVSIDGATYATVEHAYQAMKTFDPVLRAQIARTRYPGQAKKLGKSAVLRPNWEGVKESIMRFLLEQKFSYPDLRAALLATAPRRLVEGNWWHDNFWGSCECKRCGDHGRNVLGEMLMTLRVQIQQGAR